MRNSKSQIVGFLADSVLKFSTETGIFIKTPRTEFLDFSMDSPLRYYPEKVNFMQNFCPCYLCIPGYFEFKNYRVNY